MISSMTSEITFVVEIDPDGGFTAHAVGSSIFTQGDTPEQLRENVRDAVRCHFPDESTRPRIIRLHHVRDELIAA
jgi:predicted RNase H-like HicB family nuclease